MDEISNTVWQRKGSSVIFDKQCLGLLIAEGAMISLRQALGWVQSGFPENPPTPGRTILISGLETIVESLPPEAVESFLAQRVRPLILEAQSRWDDCGLVFGFSAHPNTFQESSLEEETIFARRDRLSVRLSESLWDGSATVNMKRVVRNEAGKTITVGYYVARIS